MNHFLYTVDRKINTMVILLGFWTTFWLIITYRTFSSPFSVSGILLGIVYLSTTLSFLALTIFEFLPRKKQNNYELIQTRCLHRLTFKLTLLIFFVSIIYSLVEQHYQLIAPVATFFALAILTYNTWYTTDTFMQENADTAAPNPQSGQYLEKE